MSDITASIGPNHALIVGSGDTDGWITVQRVHPSGTTVTLRDATLIRTNGGGFLVRDYELPIGVPVEYTAYLYADQNGAALVDTSNTVRIQWDSDSEWLKDPLEPARNMPILVQAPGESNFAVPAGVFAVLNRPDPITIGTVRQADQGELTLVTLESEDSAKLNRITASGNALLFQSTQESEYGNLYFQPLGLRKSSFVALRDSPERSWTLQYQETRPPVGPTAAAVTWADVVAQYDTWADLVADFTSWQDVLENFATANPVPIVTWRGA